MEKTLNDIKYLIEKLKSKIDNVLANNAVSSLERDLMLDLLKQAYLAIEELPIHQAKSEDLQMEPTVLEVKPPEPEPLPVAAPPVYIDPVKESNAVVEPQPATPPTKENIEKFHAPVTDLFGNSSIADKVKKESPSLNEAIISANGDHSLAYQMQLKPIADLRTAIGINEKFQFVNDLFDGQIEKYNEAILNLNNCGSGSEAKWILEDLKTKYNWNEGNEAFDKIQSFINRRYL
jgi:hypothetical protein